MKRTGLAPDWQESAPCWGVWLAALVSAQKFGNSPESPGRQLAGLARRSSSTILRIHAADHSNLRNTQLRFRDYSPSAFAVKWNIPK